MICMNIFLLNIANLCYTNIIMYKVEEIFSNFWWKNLTWCRLFLTFFGKHKITMISLSRAYMFDCHNSHFLKYFSLVHKLELLCEIYFYTVTSKSVVVTWQNFDTSYFSIFCEICEKDIERSYLIVKLDLFHTIWNQSNL